MKSWKDITTYSRGETERIPRIWEIEACGIRISVHRHIHYPKDTWLLTCLPFFDCRELSSKDVELAKQEAIFEVVGKFRDLADCLHDAFTSK
jgi:hypothetical protein